MACSRYGERKSWSADSTTISALSIVDILLDHNGNHYIYCRQSDGNDAKPTRSKKQFVNDPVCAAQDQIVLPVINGMEKTKGNQEFLVLSFFNSQIRDSFAQLLYNIRMSLNTQSQ